MKRSSKIKIDPEFEALCPPLTDGEYELLTQSVLDEGVHDPLAVWQGILVDGHHRLRICEENDLDFETREIVLDSREAAKQWILLNQLARRNLNPTQAAYLRGKYYRSFDLSRGGCGKRHQPNYKQGEKKNCVADALGEQFAVSQSTILKDAHLADALDSMPEEVRSVFLSREVFADKQHIIELSGLSPANQKLALKQVQRKVFGGIEKVILALRPKAIQGAPKSMCPTCRMPLAKGVVVCLRCDLSNSKVRDTLRKQEHRSAVGVMANKPIEVDEEWKDRLQSLRAAKESGEQIVFYCDQIMDYIKDNEIPRNSPIHRSLFKLMELLQSNLGKNKRYVTA